MVGCTRKFALIYIVVVNVICLTICLANLFIEKVDFEQAILIVTSLLNLILYLFIITKRNIRISYIILCIIYFIQSFSILTSSLTLKFIYGTDLTFYIINANDLTSKLDFKIFNLYAYLSTSSNGESWGLGINIIHFFVFYILLKQLKISYHQEIAVSNK